MRLTRGLAEPLGAGLEALQHGAVLDEGAVHGELIGGDAVVVLGVRHGALERLDEEAGRLARDEREEVDRLVARDGPGSEARDFAHLAWATCARCG